MRKLGWIVLMVAAHGLAGCGDSGSPSTPSAPSPVAQAGSTLPDEMRTRTYAARITPQSRPDLPANASFDVRLSGATFLDHLDGFGIGVAGGALGLWLHVGHDPAFVERVTASTCLEFSGNAAASVPASGRVDDIGPGAYIFYSLQPARPF